MSVQIYRCWIVWDDVRVIAFPSIIYLASFCTSRLTRILRASAPSLIADADCPLCTALGIAQLIESALPHSSYFAGVAKKLGIAYTSTIIGLEFIVTALICARILWAGRMYRKAMGPDVGRAYTSAAAIIVESAALTSLWGIAYLVTFALGHELEIFFLSIYVMMTVSFSCLLKSTQRCYGG